MVERIGNGMVKIGVTQEALEEGIDGLTQLKPVLQALGSRQQDKKQAAIDYAELGQHFDTAIDAMTILLLGFPDYQEMQHRDWKDNFMERFVQLN